MPFTAAVVGGNQAGITENSEMPGDGRAADVVFGGEIDDAGGTDGEPTQQVPSDRVRESGERIHA